MSVAGTAAAPTYETVLRDLALADERIVVLTAENRAAIRSLPAALGERFVDAGIAEQTLVGASAGLALRGRIPVVHALATFLTMRAFEFVRTDVGIGRLPVKLVGYVPGFLSEANGPTHQALEDVALMRGIPGMKVFCPADADDLALGLPHVVNDPSPWYVRFCARPAPIAHAPFEIGRAEVLGDGVADGDPPDVALVTYGTLFAEALDAARFLRERSLRVRLLNMRTLAPFDTTAALQAGRARLVVALEDHFTVGGVYTLLCETYVAHGVLARVLPLSLAERWFVPALLPDVLEHEGFRGDQIAGRVIEALERSAPAT